MMQRKYNVTTLLQLINIYYPKLFEAGNDTKVV